MNDEDRQMHGTDTPGPEASPPEPLRPPVPPDELWGLWDGEEWASNKPFGSTATPYVCTKRSEEVRQTLSVIRGRSYVLALLGVSPAAREQRDRLGEALAEAETAARNEMEWLQTISATASPRYRLVEGRQRRWAALLAEWRAAQEREGREADVP
jgi:hypothetical protein